MLLIELVGVIHGHPKSLKEVIRKIREFKPEVVAVELCPLRMAALRDFMEKKAPLFFLGGGIIPSLMGAVEWVVQGITKLRPGLEMAVAIKEAERVGAEVVPIDRDIAITLMRLKFTPFREKLRMLLDFVASVPLLPFLLKGEGPSVEELVSRLKRRYPYFYRVLVEEREEYMANKLSELDAIYGRVLVVVGAGHVKGLKEKLEKRQRYEFKIVSYWP